MIEKQSTTYHYLISGRVQGVFYRASAAEEARRLGLAGWVRNLPDGRVECMATGDSPALQTFKKWLLTGPPAAEVESVEELTAEPAALQQPLPLPFKIRRH